MRRLHLGNHRLQRLVDDETGEIGEGMTGLGTTDRAGQQANADQEALLGGKDAQPVEDFLVVAGAGEKALQPLAEIVAGGKFDQQARSSMPSKTCGRSAMISASLGQPP